MNPWAAPRRCATATTRHHRFSAVRCRTSPDGKFALKVGRNAHIDILDDAGRLQIGDARLSA
jgi:hypothetical protein